MQTTKWCTAVDIGYIPKCQIGWTTVKEVHLFKMVKMEKSRFSTKGKKKTIGLDAHWIKSLANYFEQNVTQISDMEIHTEKILAENKDNSAPNCKSTIMSPYQQKSQQ